MIAPLIITYLMISVMVTMFAIGRRISFAGAFFTSIFMSPLLGLIAILKTDKIIRIKHYSTKYVCPKCNIEHNENLEYCSFCREMGKLSKLEKRKVLITE